MIARPYLTFNGECSEAIELYKKAFKTEELQIMRFGDIPPNPSFTVPEDFKERIVQCTLKFGEGFIRMSDRGPGQKLNDAESERLSIAVEADVETIRFAYEVLLTNEGETGIPLAETFYSPLAGAVFDRFGVMWNLSAV